MIRSCSRMSRSIGEMDVPSTSAPTRMAPASFAPSMPWAGTATRATAFRSGPGNASGASLESMKPASELIDGASSKIWRNVIRTPNCFLNWALAWVRNSESSPSSMKSRCRPADSRTVS